MKKTLTPSPLIIYTKEEVAVHLRISVKTLERRVEEGKIISYKEGKFVRFTSDALQAYKNSCYDS